MSILNESVEWSFESSIFAECKALWTNFEREVKSVRDEVLSQLQLLEPHNVEKLKSKSRANYENDIQFMCDKNKELKSQIEECSEKLALEKQNAEKMKKDQVLLQTEIKDTHEAFLTAKSFYKIRLHLYFDILDVDKQGVSTIFVQFFTDRKQQSGNYSATFRWEESSGNCELIGTTPKLAAFQDIRDKLKETNDVSGALCCIRKSFRKLKHS